MQVTVYGASYVGLVSAVCLAELGHSVCCLDIDEKKIALLSQGKIPIYEQGLQKLLQKNLVAGNIRFTQRIKEAVDFAEIQIIAVGTPSAIDGSVDLQQVETLVKSIAVHVNQNKIVVIKSTVPVGTAEKLHTMMNGSIVSNPEFLKEGNAVEDFMNPDRILIGSTDEYAIRMMRQLYEFFIKKNVPFIVMDPRSAELSKYAANAFLATKISFMNEMSALAEALHADIESIKLALGFDPRIGNQFLNPGCGFGGSCFPKDLQALRIQAAKEKLPTAILNAVWEVNEHQKTILFRKIQNYFQGSLKNRVIALWGLAFKPNTDDVRCAPSCALMEKLWQAGACVRAYDPLAMQNIQKIYTTSEQLTLCASAEETWTGADALAIVTEWDEFRNPNFIKMKKYLHYPVIFDGRNIFDSKQLIELGFDYFCIGKNTLADARGSLSRNCSLEKEPRASASVNFDGVNNGN